MIDSPDYYAITTYIVIGMITAGALLFYLRNKKPDRQLRYLAIALGLVSAIYLVFALVDGNKIWLTVEVVGLLLFLLFIWMAFHYSYWFVVLGWALHIVWDVGVHPQETAPYVPYWYAWLCVGFDALVAIYLGWLLARMEGKKQSEK